MTWIWDYNQSGEVWLEFDESFDQETGLVTLEVIPPGVASYTLSGNVDHEFRFWELEYAEVWIDSRACIDFEGPLPAVKLQEYDLIERLVNAALNNPPDRIEEY
jgi:hypothetical protein